MINLEIAQKLVNGTVLHLTFPASHPYLLCRPLALLPFVEKRMERVALFSDHVLVNR